MKCIVKTDSPLRCLCFLCYEKKCFFSSCASKNCLVIIALSISLHGFSMEREMNRMLFFHFCSETALQLIRAMKMQIQTALLKSLFKLCRIQLWSLLTVYLQGKVRWFLGHVCDCVAGACEVGMQDPSLLRGRCATLKGLESHFCSPAGQG